MEEKNYTQVINEGYQAYQDGKHESDNPYKDGSIEYDYWSHGFEKAEFDKINRDNPKSV